MKKYKTLKEAILNMNEETNAQPQPIKFNGKLLKFLEVGECDFCGRKTWVGVTNFGTTHYNRLICKECAEEIIDYNKRTFNTNIGEEFNLKENMENVEDFISKQEDHYILSDNIDYVTYYVSDSEGHVYFEVGSDPIPAFDFLVDSKKELKPGYTEIIREVTDFDGNSEKYTIAYLGRDNQIHLSGTDKLYESKNDNNENEFVEETNTEETESETTLVDSNSEVERNIQENTFADVTTGIKNSVWDIVSTLNGLIVNAEVDNCPNKEEVITLLNEIMDEETIVVGMLEKVSELINEKRSTLVQQGKEKAENLLENDIPTEE